MPQSWLTPTQRTLPDRYRGGALNIADIPRLDDRSGKTCKKDQGKHRHRPRIASLNPRMTAGDIVARPLREPAASRLRSGAPREVPALVDRLGTAIPAPASTSVVPAASTEPA